jgi:hypothetical protein
MAKFRKLQWAEEVDTMRETHTVYRILECTSLGKRPFQKSSRKYDLGETARKEN